MPHRLRKRPKFLRLNSSPLVLFQLDPLAVLVTNQGQSIVGDDAVTFVFKLKAVVNIQVAVETEGLSHQTDLVDRFPAERHTVSLHGIGIALGHLFMEVL